MSIDKWSIRQAINPYYPADYIEHLEDDLWRKAGEKITDLLRDGKMYTVKIEQNEQPAHLREMIDYYNEPYINQEASLSTSPIGYIQMTLHVSQVQQMDIVMPKFTDTGYLAYGDTTTKGAVITIWRNAKRAIKRAVSKPNWHERVS